VRPPTTDRLRQAYLSFWRRFTTGSTNRQVFRAAVTIAALTSVAKLASVAKELLVARRFGTGATIEAFLVAVLIPMLAINVISNSFSIALIPTYIAVREKEGREAAQRLLSGVTVWSVLLLGLATVSVLGSSRLYLPWIASGFNEKKLVLTFQLLCVVSPIIVLSGIANIWGAVLNAGERFALVALAPVITPSVTLMVLFIFRYSIFALPAGMVIGAGFEMILLGIALKLRGISLRPRWYGLDSDLRQVAGQFGPRVGGNLLRSGSTVVDRSLAATLPGGSVATLNYGDRVTVTLLSVAGAALGSAITPYYSKMVTHRDWAGVRHTLKHYLLLLLLVSIPVVGILYFSAAPIVRILFERGSFRARDTNLVAHVHALYTLQIPFYLGNVLLSRLLSSLLATKITMWAAAINLALNIVLDILLIRVMGVSGIALATACGSMVTFGFVSYHTIKILRTRAASSPPVTDKDVT
jgi:putative peptidoglycan lipid II flippase